MVNFLQARSAGGEGTVIELLMYFAIGFFVAGLIATLLLVLVHNHAVDLTMRRLDAAMPLPLAEIRADKSQVRADYAMVSQRLKLTIEDMHSRATAQLAELGRKADMINCLKKELGEKTATIADFATHNKLLQEQIPVVKEELKIKSKTLSDALRSLADKDAELARLAQVMGDPSIEVDSQRIELAALDVKGEAYKVRVAEYERTLKEARERLARELAVNKDLAQTRARLDDSAKRSGELERQLVAGKRETELLDRRVQELETTLGNRGRLLVERDDEIERLRGEVEAGRLAESELRSELSVFAKGGGAAAERSKTNIAQLESQLADTLKERMSLQTEITAIKGEVEFGSGVAGDDVLRERIKEIAAEVVRLVAALEGPGSPIETMLGGAAPTANPDGNGNCAEGCGNSVASRHRRTLIDRIRALRFGPGV